MKKKLIMLLIILSISFISSCKNKNEINNPINNQNNIENNENELNDNQDNKEDEYIQNEGQNNNNDNDEEEIIPKGFYISSDSKGGIGTFDNPCSISMLSNLNNDNNIYLRGGVYKLNEVINLSKSGTSDKLITISNYKNEEVIFDFGNYYSKDETLTNIFNSSKYRGITISGNYYHLKGITVKGAGSIGIFISGNNNIVENCVAAYNGCTGIQISGSSSKTFDEWPCNNLIKNCTSYANYDWNRTDGNQGEDADGFACKITAGNNNVFDGCIAYNNSDDGWDLFTKIKTGKIGSVTIKNCVAFKNGYWIDGTELKNGNGFKLGGRAIEVDHYVENCVAFNNKATGFDDNSNPGTITLNNCTGYNNGNRNFGMGRFVLDDNTYDSTWYEGEDLMGPIYNVPKSHNVINNCISYKGVNRDLYVGTITSSYLWNKGFLYGTGNFNHESNPLNKISISMPFKSINCDFINDIDNIHYILRNDNGSVNLGDFLSSLYSFKGANLK